MPAFGERSRRNLSTLHPLLQVVLARAIEHVDFGIIYGWRSREEQDRLVADGKSKLRWPRSKHNNVKVIDGIELPWSLAADVYLWVPGKGYVVGNGSVLGSVAREREAMCWLAGYLMGVGDMLGIPLRWGGDWDGNVASPNRFDDFGHFELVEA